MSDNKILQAIDYLEAQKRLFPNSFNVLSGHFDSAIEALQEKAEREAGCEYCDFSSGDVGATLNNCGDDFVLIRSEDGISIATDDKHFKMVGVKFCPNCGRDLRKR